MAGQDYLFLALLMLSLAVFFHWAGTHHLKH